MISMKIGDYELSGKGIKNVAMEDVKKQNVRMELALDKIKTELNRSQTEFQDINKKYDTTQSQFQDLKKKYDFELNTTNRPRLEAMQSMGTDAVRIPYWPLSISAMYDLAKYSDIITLIINAHKNEGFKEGIGVQEKFKCKCAACDIEMETVDEDMICDKCGGTMLEPDIKEKQFLEKWIIEVNRNGQSLIDVIKMCDEDIQILDNAFLIALKNYIYTADGSVFSAKVNELLRGDPVFFNIIADKSGLKGVDEKGNRMSFCPVHRDELLTNEDVCNKCKKKTFTAAYEAKTTDDKKIYYSDDEVLHFTFYSNSLTWGYPRIIAAWQKTISLIEQDRTIKEYYIRGRSSRGALFIKTANIDSLEKMFTWVVEQFKKNPHQITPWPVEVPPGENLGDVAKFIDFGYTLQEMEYSAVREEYRRSLAMLWGVSPIFAGDKSSGGLSNDSMEITLTNRTMKAKKMMYDNRPLRWIAKQLGIRDYALAINEPEKLDEMTKLRIEAQKLANAQMRAALGFRITGVNEDGDFEFETKPSAPPQQFGSGLGDIATRAEEQRISGEPLNIHRGAGAIDIATPGFFQPSYSKRIRKIYDNFSEDVKKETGIDVKKADDDEKLQEKLDFVAKALYDKKFEFLPSHVSEKIKDVLLAGLEKRQGIEDIIKQITKITGVKSRASREEVGRIARTEHQALTMKLREWNYQEADPEGKWKFKWINPNDARTTQICKNIIARTRDGVSVEELKKIVKEEGEAGGFETRDFTPHINCRSVFIRAV